MEKKIVKSICRMCGSACGIDVEVENNKVIKISGDLDNSVNKGRICIKGSSAVTWVNLPNRITKPLKKTENGFVEIEIEQAMDEIAEKIKKIQERDGKQAVGIWKGEGIGFSTNEAMARRWAHAIGSPNYFSNDSQCYSGRYVSFNLNYGFWPEADLRNSKLIMMWGTNSPAAHSYWAQHINDAKAKGGKLVVIDTKYTEEARVADVFILMKPGCDIILAYGLMNEMINRNLVDMEFINKFTKGFDELKEYAKTFTKEYVKEHTGIEPSIIDQVVDMMDVAKPAICSWPGTGLEHSANGASNCRAVSFVDILLGALDKKGGMLETIGLKSNNLKPYGTIDVEETPIGSIEHPVLYELYHECDSLGLMDVILSGKYNGKDYPFKALVMTAANPTLTNANSNKVIEAFKKLELFVVKDLFMTETAELADYVLPAASYLERHELHYNAVAQSVFLAPKIIENDIQTEYQLIKGLADRLGAGKYFPWKNEEELITHIIEPSGYTFQDLLNNPSGLKHAEYEYDKHEKRLERGEKVFNTPSGLIEFTSGILEKYGYEPLAKFNVLPEYMKEENEEYPICCMTGARKVMYFHGRYRNIPELKRAVPKGYIEMHPNEAKKYDVKTDDMVRVTSRKGSIDIAVKVMHEKAIYPGSVQITHGFADCNVNYLTNDDYRDPITGFPSLKSICVKIEKI